MQRPRRGVPRVDRVSRLLIAASLIAAGRCESQEPGTERAASSDAQGDCQSVVLLRCAQAPQEPAQSDTRQRLDSERLRQMQSEVGLDTIEINAERPHKFEPEPWENFRRSVSNAAMPDCWHPGALRQKTFVVGGLLALPFLVHAAIVGKCR